MNTIKNLKSSGNIKKASRSLVCYCNGICPLGRGFGMCKTQLGGKCYTSRLWGMKPNGEKIAVVEYGCLPPGTAVEQMCRQQEQPFVAGKNGIKCCNDGRFCNFPIPQSSISKQARADNNSTPFLNIYMCTFEALAAPLLAIFLLLGLIILFAHFKNDKRKKKISTSQMEDPEGMYIADLAEADKREGESTIYLRSVDSLVPSTPQDNIFKRTDFSGTYWDRELVSSYLALEGLERWLKDFRSNLEHFYNSSDKSTHRNQDFRLPV